MIIENISSGHIEIINKTSTVIISQKGTQGPSGGGSGGDLPTNITSPQSGDILTFDQSDQSWHNARRQTLVDGGNF